MVDDVMNVLDRTIGLASLSPLHGRIEVFSMLLEQNGKVDVLNRHKHASLKTCLNYAACCGHVDCLKAIRSAAHSTPVADSWGFARFVNIKCGNGAMPLHLVARHRQLEYLHSILASGLFLKIQAKPRVNFRELYTIPVYTTMTTWFMLSVRSEWGFDLKKHWLRVVGRTLSASGEGPTVPVASVSTTMDKTDRRKTYQYKLRDSKVDELRKLSECLTEDYRVAFKRAYGNLDAQYWTDRHARLAEFASQSLEDLPGLLKKAYADMFPQNTPKTVFHFVSVCRVVMGMIKFDLHASASK
ncbi:hypothetical protein KIW84_011436 [Lathyrus oleraceus]|uniref:ANK_REP_REGION domain-containing protein n=1 Tax=Pisum sativum TaxID=3888 RepID=A0A9D5BEX0_PEA|nr:hypothetical protein KIW84_011436 [Pisum sativum]